MIDKHTDAAAGRVEEAAGSLTGDDGLKEEGRADQGKADLNEEVDKAADKVKELLDRSFRRRRLPGGCLVAAWWLPGICVLISGRRRAGSARSGDRHVDG